MLCDKQFKDVNYEAEIFCRTCGMDIGMNPVIVRHKSYTMISKAYCCEDCARVQ